MRAPALSTVFFFFVLS